MSIGRKEHPPPFSSTLSSLVWPMSAEQFVSGAMQTDILFQRGGEGRLALLRDELASFDLPFLFALGEEATIWKQGGRETTRGSDSAKDVDALIPGVTVQTHLTKLPLGKRFISDLAHQMRLESGFFSIFASQDSQTTTHYDGNYNFTIQLAGKKTWTVHSAAPAVYAPSGGAALEEDRLARMSPHMHGASFRSPAGPPSTYLMTPGDILYVPPGFWHATECQGRSVQLNLSIEPLSWFEVVCRALAYHLESRQNWRAHFGVPSPSDANLYLSELKHLTERLTAEDILPSLRDTSAVDIYQPLRRTLGSLLMWEKEGAGLYYGLDELRYLAKGTNGREIEVLKADMEPVIAALAQLEHAMTVAHLCARFGLECNRVCQFVQRLLDLGYLVRSQSTNSSSSL